MDVTITELGLMLDDLKYFGHNEIFTPAFIRLLKEEIPILKQEAISANSLDWNNINDGMSSRYMARLHQRQARLQRSNKIAASLYHDDGSEESNDEDETIDDSSELNGRERIILTFDNWKKDPGERLRRIWEWWNILHKSCKNCGTDSSL